MCSYGSTHDKPAVIPVVDYELLIQVGSISGGFRCYQVKLTASRHRERCNRIRLRSVAISDTIVASQVVVSSVGTITAASILRSRKVRGIDVLVIATRGDGERIGTIVCLGTIKVACGDHEGVVCIDLQPDTERLGIQIISLVPTDVIDTDRGARCS